MDLHRTKKKPDWEGIQTGSRTYWQRLGAQTNGFITPANIATALGLLIVLIGLQEIGDDRYLIGLFTVLAGRCFDVLDGWLAEQTKTKSPLGEIFDAAVDKVETFFALLVFYISGIAPGWTMLLLLLPHLIIVAISYIALKRHARLHPSRRGKLSMAAAWLALLSFVWMHANVRHATALYKDLSYSLVYISVLLGLSATIGYLLELRRLSRLRKIS